MSKVKEYEFHPLAELFPSLEGPEFNALVEDIKEHGLLESIVLFEGKRGQRGAVSIFRPPRWPAASGLPHFASQRLLHLFAKTIISKRCTCLYRCTDIMYLPWFQSLSK